MEVTPKILYSLKLHEIIIPDNSNAIMRVPGGWIYQMPTGCVFVPYNNEFQDECVTK